jgi:predicted negative regulator of RcsB-dependent stress response
MSQLDSASQDLPASGMEKFFEDNARKLGWLFIIAVVAACAGALVMHKNNLKAEEAAEAFTGAKTLEDCDLVISRYPGTTPAANALLLKADLLWDQNKKSSAVEALKEFTTKDSSNPLAVYALLGLGSKYDAMGDRKEAQAVFERIVNEFASSEAAPLAQVRLGDLLWEAGKTDEAKKAYEDLAVKFPDAAEYQSISQNRLGWIAASLPTKEVDPPPAPKVIPPAPAGPLPAGVPIGATLTPATKPTLKLNSVNSGLSVAPAAAPRLVPPPASAPAIPSTLPVLGPITPGVPVPMPVPGVTPPVTPATAVPAPAAPAPASASAPAPVNSPPAAPATPPAAAAPAPPPAAPASDAPKP